ncbi:hypothetical protein HMPREF1580_00266 [Gardnerella vaginalis JCP8070]|nr:hypothetical protein HMPREF1580_00266 [Gardnerella vaginalis JCP8070]
MLGIEIVLYKIRHAFYALTAFCLELRRFKCGYFYVFCVIFC